jgi:hypothetical protein
MSDDAHELGRKLTEAGVSFKVRRGVIVVDDPKRCVVCGVGPREVPDRERMGRPIKRVCRSCHRLRLAGDIREILRLRAIRERAHNEAT